MDKNGKIFGKVSIFDLIIILLIIVVGFGSVYKFTSERTNVEGGQRPLVYTIGIPNVRDFTLQYYQVGLRCFCSRTGEELGTITAVRSEPFMDVQPDLRGNALLVEVPGRIKIELDLETMGLETDRGFYAAGTFEIRAGSEIMFHTKYVDVTGVVERVSVKD
ncbi:MAG: DUF4330 domain-containing protein [Defluviitaleaceae bacterium]|nr:DUF4330 domain-containing protein [Defluviitaleaceae bacterium]